MNNYEEQIDGYSVQMVRRFVEKRSDYYINRFKRYGDKRNFNWAAFFFGPIWFAYRLMWKESLLVLAIQSAVLCLSSLPVFLVMLYTGINCAVLGMLVMVIETVIIGNYGNPVYWKSLKRKMAEMESESKTDGTIQNPETGTSGFGGILMWFLNSFAIGAAVEIATQAAYAIYFRW